MSKEIKEIKLGAKNGRDQYVSIVFKDGDTIKYLLKDFPYSVGGPVIIGSYKVENISNKQ